MRTRRDLITQLRKPLLILLCAAAVFVLLFVLQHREHEAKKEALKDAPYRIMVAADLHYLSPKLTDGGAYFTRMIEGGDGKTIMYSRELADALMRAARSEKPDLLILAGDLSFNGEKTSLEELAAQLKELKSDGIGVIVMPGNHDIENDAASSFHGDAAEKTESVSSSGFDDLFYETGTGAAISKDDASLSYMYGSSKGVRILMLDVNAGSALGSVSDETLKWARQQLRSAQKQDIPVIAVSHQNLQAHNSLFREGFMIGGAEKLQELYNKYGVICNLSGHMHMQHIDAQAAVPEIVTGALCVFPHYYGMIEFDGAALSYAAKELPVGDDPEGFSAWSEGFFDRCSRRSIRELLAAKDLRGADEDALADAFAELNRLYFAGRSDRIGQIDDLDQLLDVMDGDDMLEHYVRSIMDDPPCDSRSVVIR